MLTVKSCCCGCTLRAGTLILLWFGTIFVSLSTLSIPVNGVQQHVPFHIILKDFLIGAIITGIFIMGIFGVEKKRPSFLIPYLGFHVLLMVLGIIFIAYTAIFGAIFGLASHVAVPPDTHRNEHLFSGLEEVISTVLLGIAICFLFLLVLAFYLFIVVLSFYKELKGERENFQIIK